MNMTMMMTPKNVVTMMTMVTLRDTIWQDKGGSGKGNNGKGGKGKAKGCPSGKTGCL
jgi:hypothetical protein